MVGWWMVSGWLVDGWWVVGDSDTNGASRTAATECECAGSVCAHCVNHRIVPTNVLAPVFAHSFHKVYIADGQSVHPQSYLMFLCFLNLPILCSVFLCVFVLTFLVLDDSLLTFILHRNV